MGLCGLALGQPLLHLFARYPAFLVTHGAQPIEIGFLLVGLLLIAPLAIWLPLEIAIRISPRFGRSLFLLAVATAVGLALLPPLSRQLAIAGQSVLVLAFAAGTLASAAYGYRESIRSVATLLGLAPLAFLGNFAVSESGHKLLFPETVVVEGAGIGESDIPVVFVVFDELPTSSLLDESGEIDAGRYPSFARLASQSTWYRYSRTIHPNTMGAVPGILTGRIGNPKLLATAQDHPFNLFTMLDRTHELHVYEGVTRIFTGDAANTFVWSNLLSDIRLLALHIILPKDLTADLPPIGDDWRDFGILARKNDDESAPPARWNREGNWHHFVSSIESSPVPALHFVHIKLPHKPWHTLPSGRSYPASANTVFDLSFWFGDANMAHQAEQRHLLQLGFTDRLLGELLDRLEATGLFDQSLIIVTADHGISFWPGEYLRDAKASKHPEDVLGVPLFVKLPFQDQSRISDLRALNIDLLPTVADLVGLEIPWEVDGCSIVDSSCERPQRGHFLAPLRWKRVDFDAERLTRLDTTRRTAGLFGSGSIDGLMSWVPHFDWIGRMVDFSSLPSFVGGRFRLSKNLRLRPAEEQEAACFNGRLELSETTTTPYAIGVVHGGKLLGTAHLLRILPERLIFSILPPDPYLQIPVAEAEFIVFQGSPDDPKLMRVERHR